MAPPPVLLPGKSHGQRSLVGCSPWCQTQLSDFTFTHWRRKWQPTPVFLPVESQGRQSLVGCHLWSHIVRHNWSDLAAATAASTWPNTWIIRSYSGVAVLTSWSPNCWMKKQKIQSVLFYHLHPHLPPLLVHFGSSHPEWPVLCKLILYFHTSEPFLMLIPQPRKPL